MGVLKNPRIFHHWRRDSIVTEVLQHRQLRVRFDLLHSADT